MGIQKIEPYDAAKLAEARRLVNEVYGYYYSSPNSRMICGRLATVRISSAALLSPGPLPTMKSSKGGRRSGCCPG